MGYNGKGFRKNNYHVKAAASLNKWRGIRDTPYNPHQTPPEPPTAPLPLDVGDYEQTTAPSALATFLKMIGMRK
jgi:hypothetical protein